MSSTDKRRERPMIKISFGLEWIIQRWRGCISTFCTLQCFVVPYFANNCRSSKELSLTIRLWARDHRISVSGFFNNFKFLQSWNRECILFSLLRKMIIRLFPNGSTRNRRLQPLHPKRGAISDAWNRVCMMALVFKAENRSAQLSAYPQGYDWALLIIRAAMMELQRRQRRAVIRYSKMSFVNILILG